MSSPTRSRNRRLMTLLVMGIATPAFAQTGDADCDSDHPAFAERIAESLNYSTDASVFKGACKAWPARPGTTIVALAHGHPNAEYPDEVSEFDLDLLLVDSHSGHVQKHEQWRNVYTSDAIYFSSLSIDTARYQLTPSLRAFGVRAQFIGASRANPYGNEELTLYVEENGRLRPVLNALPVSTSRGEWDTACEGTFVDNESVLAISDARSRGWADLILRTTSKRTVNTPKGDDCIATETSTELPSRTLRYDGSQYPVPRDLSAW